MTLAGPEGFPAYMGIAVATALANIGAAYGTAKAGVGITGIGVRKPHLIMKS